MKIKTEVMRPTKKLLLALAVLLLSCSTVSADPVIDALKEPGNVALMRHAIAPGMGDPDNFTLRDCATQRNLSDNGRAQAVATGRYLREQGLEEMAVYSSQWCRCLETARLLDFGEVTELPFLNSFFQDWDDQQARTQKVKSWISNAQSVGSAILVTHQVNITALTDIVPASGEIVVDNVDEAGKVKTIGTLELP